MTDERNNGRWARTSLVISSASLSVEEIGRTMGQPTAGKKAKNVAESVWAADLESDDSLPLTDQLIEAERFIADKIEALEELASSCEIYLFSSWTPKPGQDHALFSPTLVKLLARVGADIVIDTWTADESDDDDDPPAADS